MKVKDLKRGTYFCKKDIPCPADNQVWVRGDYDRESRRYECMRFSDVCDVQYLRGDKDVFCDFTF